MCLLSPFFSAQPSSLFTRLCLNAATQWGSCAFGRRTRAILTVPLEGGSTSNEPRNSPLATILASRPKIILSQFWPDLPRSRFPLCNRRAFRYRILELSILEKCQQRFSNT